MYSSSTAAADRCVYTFPLAGGGLHSAVVVVLRTYCWAFDLPLRITVVGVTTVLRIDTYDKYSVFLNRIRPSSSNSGCHACTAVVDVQSRLTAHKPALANSKTGTVLLLFLFLVSATNNARSCCWHRSAAS